MVTLIDSTTVQDSIFAFFQKTWQTVAIAVPERFQDIIPVSQKKKKKQHKWTDFPELTSRKFITWIVFHVLGCIKCNMNFVLAVLTRAPLLSRIMKMINDSNQLCSTIW